MGRAGAGRHPVRAMTLPEAVAGAIQAWAEFKADHRVVARALAFSHLAGILMGGGTAIFMDRSVLRVWRGTEAARAAVLEELGRAHHVVVPALAVVVLTGGLWTLSELDQFLASPLYWTKMGLIGLLLVNGYAMMRAERSARAGDARGWSRLRVTAAASLGLWFATLLAGRFL